jgi:flagellar hook-length control protein FliK
MSAAAGAAATQPAAGTSGTAGAAAPSAAAVSAVTAAPAGPDAAGLLNTGIAGAAGLSQAGPSAAVAAPAAAPTLQIHASVESSEFPQNLSERVSWMMTNGVNSAKLQVNPAQLGPIELNILVQGNHAQVSMAAHSAVTRDALQSSSPQLREMLGAQGFGQVSVDISQRSFQDRAAPAPLYAQAPAGQSAASAASGPAAGVSSQRSSAGVLDAYA